MSQFFKLTSILDSFGSLTVAEIRSHAAEAGVNIPSNMTSRIDLRQMVEFPIRAAKDREIRDARKAAEDDLHRREKRTDLSLRQQTDPDKSLLEEPFLYIYDYEPHATPIVGQVEITLNHQWWLEIEHYYWIFGGAHDDESWRFLARLKNGIYVFYTASCDYTGFDCQGDMKVWASHDPAVLLLYAMGNRDYDLYYADTKPFDNF